MTPPIADTVVDTAHSRADERLGLDGDSPGARFAKSPLYTRNVDRLRNGAGLDDGTISLLSAPETVAALRTRSVDALRDEPQHTDVALQPLPARVPGLVRQVITEQSTVLATSHAITNEGAAHGLPAGSDPATDPAYPQGVHVLSGSRLTLGRWGVAAQVPDDALVDHAEAARVVDELVNRLAVRGLEDDIVTGDGSTTATRVRFMGLTSVTGRQAHARDTAGGETRHGAIAEAIRLAQVAGFTAQPLQVIASPTTAKAITEETDAQGNYLGRDLRRAVPEVSDVVVTNALTDGTVLLTPLRTAATLYVRGGWRLSLSRSHGDGFLNGWATLRLHTSAALWLPYPKAIVELTSMA